MNKVCVITIRPVSSYSFYYVKYSVGLINNDFNRAVRDALRLAKKSFKDAPIIRLDVVSIDVI